MSKGLEKISESLHINGREEYVTKNDLKYNSFSS